MPRLVSRKECVDTISVQAILCGGFIVRPSQGRAAFVLMSTLLILSACEDNPVQPSHATAIRVGPALSLGSSSLYTAIDLGAGPFSQATAINLRGQIVGWGLNTHHAFLWQKGVIKDLGTLRSGYWSEAYGINVEGHVVGQSFVSEDANWHAVMWRNGSVIDLGFPGETEARGINFKDQVVGTILQPPPFIAFLWARGQVTYLPCLADPCWGFGVERAAGINGAGQVVGPSLVGPPNPNGAPVHAWLWQAGVIIDLGTLGGRNSFASAINGAGWVVGWSQTAAGDSHAFLWHDGLMTDLGPGAALGISPVGHVVGEADPTGSGVEHAVVWKRNGTIVDLGPGKAYGMNLLGQVVGIANVGSESHATLWTRPKCGGASGDESETTLAPDPCS